ncbi:MAG: aminoacetone oxidase family FAD-binding enzyme, partial [Lachnospiraceae bacterium]|nr:aminoacetone oxidase family FAD-binding enzyme [Lachnospiraceae bacterium]
MKQTSKRKRVGVIGGGAAGMMAAITAARQGALVTIFERNERMGKKLLVTGNGKCNLGNFDLSEKQYYGSSSEFIKNALKQFDTEDTVQFFNGLGLILKVKNGYLYPACEQAAVVLDVLRYELEALGIQVMTKTKIHTIQKKHDSKQIQLGTDKEQFVFDAVILACGSKAAPKTGSDGSGYKLAKQLGHTIIPTVPALVQLRCMEDYFKGVSGVRADARIQVLLGRECIARERGELQLTDYGISGIPVFQISRIVNYILREEKQVCVEIDFLPDYSEEEFEAMCRGRLLLQKERTVEEFFTGILNKKLMTLFIKQAGLKGNTKVALASPEKLNMVYQLCRKWTVHVVGSNPYDNAQVCAGGVDTSEVTECMESKRV